MVHTLYRERSLDEDLALVFRQDDEERSLIRFRVEDFLTHVSDPSVYVCGSFLYQFDQLPGEAGQWRREFGAAFTDVELIEGTNMQILSLDEVVAIVPVVSTEKFKSMSTDGASAADVVCHQGSAFVDDDPRMKWKKVTAKARAPPQGGQGGEDARAKRRRLREGRT